METIALTIDGRKVSSPAGTSILEAAHQHGIKIPNLCYHPDLKPYGACRMCLVEDEKTGRLLAACVTPIAPDMMIQTTTPRIVDHRRNIARFCGGELTFERVWPSLCRQREALAGAACPVSDRARDCLPDWGALASATGLSGRRDIIAAIRSEFSALH